MLNSGRWEREDMASRGTSLGKRASTTAAERGMRRKLWQMLIKKLQKLQSDKIGMLHIFNAVTAYSEYDLILIKERINCFLVG